MSQREDEKCAKGGKWTYYFPKSKDTSDLDDNWLTLLLELIGEQFVESIDIWSSCQCETGSNTAYHFGQRLLRMNRNNWRLEDISKLYLVFQTQKKSVTWYMMTNKTRATEQRNGIQFEKLRARNTIL